MDIIVNISRLIKIEYDREKCYTPLFDIKYFEKCYVIFINKLNHVLELFG